MQATKIGLTSIRTDGDKIEIVNQLLLPHATEFIEINTIDEAHDAIKTMKIRGAPAIASLAALAFAADLSRALKSSADFVASPESMRAYVEPVLAHLYTARPTAVNLGAATRRLTATLDASIAAGKTGPDVCADLIAEAHKVNDEDVGRNKKMSQWGGDWLADVVKQNGGSGTELNVLTVCNTGSLATSGYGTALGLITYLHETGKLGTAYYTQTAPYHQGSRLTALELQTLDIPSVMICDTMVGSLFQHHNIHAVVVGADRVAKNGDTANKVGLLSAPTTLPSSPHGHKIPFVVVAPISTVDLAIADGSGYDPHRTPAPTRSVPRPWRHPPPTEEAKQAVVMITPAGLKGIYNPSFDVTPAELITAIVTEKGVATRREGELVFDLSGVV
ncbi:Methylthioribose-1-phosphate isomerase [Mycena sanguinolenta]|uniref:Methylthioribose-1-phosphate isomerase n=1 Tax=Mycena sanguinolenta TaxID=230812 RepID=A0A8H6ZFE0_9AGAR|nr:Methylthioribose-1-phosphate isomerase [Mycena sanguinolenta]